MNGFISAGLLLGLGVVAQARACDGLTLENARIIEAPPGATVLAAYASLHNAGKQALTITGVDGPDFATAEFQQMSMVNGMMHMQRQDDLVIPAQGSLTLRTGENHLMLMDPKRLLKSGDSSSLVIHCGASYQTFSFHVQLPQPPQ